MLLYTEGAVLHNAGGALRKEGGPPHPSYGCGRQRRRSFFFCSTGPILLVVYAFYEAYKRVFLPSPPTKGPAPAPATSGKTDLALVQSPAEAEKMAVQYYRDVVRSAV